MDRNRFPIPSSSRQEDGEEDSEEEASEHLNPYAVAVPSVVTRLAAQQMGDNSSWLESATRALVPQHGGGETVQVAVPEGDQAGGQAIVQTGGDSDRSARQTASGNIIIYVRSNEGTIIGINQQMGADGATQSTSGAEASTEHRPALESPASESWQTSEQASVPLPRQPAPEPRRSVPQESKKLQNLIANTRQEIATCCPQSYVETPALKAATDLLKQQGTCLILGLPGHGKTTLALQAMARLEKTEKLKPVHMDKPEQWELLPGVEEVAETEQHGSDLNTGENEADTSTVPKDESQDTRKNLPDDAPKYVVFVEDIFGKGNYNEDKYLGWGAKVSQMLAKIRAGQVKLIIVSRTHIFQMCKDDLKHNELFQHLETVQLLDRKYWGSSCHEKILCEFLKYCNAEINVLVPDLIKASSHSPIGFPQSCFYFASNPEAQKLGAEFFSNPAHFLSSQFKAMKTSDPKSFFVLVLTWVQNGHLSGAFLQNYHAETSNFLSHVQAMCGLKESLNIGEVRDIAESLRGVYLSPDSQGDGFRFCHQSVWDSLVVMVCQTNFEQALELCSFQQLSEYVITVGSGRKQTGLTYAVPRHQWPLLAARIVRELTAGGIRAALQHPALKDDQFLKELTKHFTSDDLTTILSQKCDISDGTYSWRRHNVTSLAGIIQHRIPALAAHLLHSKEMEKIPESSRRQLLQEALHTACCVSDRCSVDLLLKKGAKVDPKLVSTACSAEEEDVSLLRAVYEKLDKNDGDLVWYENILWQCCCKVRLNSLRYLLKKTSILRKCDQALDRVFTKLVKKSHPLSYSECRYLPRLSELFQVLKEAGAKLTSEVDVWLAAGHSDPFVLKELISRGDDLTAKDREGRLPIECAVRSGSAQCLEILIKATSKDKGSMDVNYVDQRGRSLIYRAVEDHKWDVISTLLQHGADLNIADENGRHPLHLCANFSIQDQEALEIILQKSKDINCRDKDERTPLHLAAKAGNACTLETLLNHHADTDLKDSNGDLPLHLCCTWHKNIPYCFTKEKTWADYNIDLKQQVETHLVEATRDKDHTNKQGNTPLHLAAQTGNLSMIKILLEHDTKVDIPNNDGNFPLHCIQCDTPYHDCKNDVCLQEKQHVETLLVQKTSNKDHQNNTGDTPLHVAIKKTNVHLTELLLEHYVNAEKENNNGDFALHCYCSNYMYGEFSQTQNIETLLLQKTSVKDHQNMDGDTPLHLAVKRKNYHLTETLLRHHAGNHRNKKGNAPLHLAIKLKDIPLTKLLLEHGARADTCDESGQFPFELLCTHCREWKNDMLEVKELLLSNILQGDCKNSKGQTHLHLAVIEEDSPVVEYLLSRNANANVGDCDGNFPLHFLCIQSYQKLQKVAAKLVKKTSNLNHGNNKGLSPLNLTFREPNYCMMEVLLIRGVRTDGLDNSGALPLHHFCSLLQRCERKNTKLRKRVGQLFVKKTLDINLRDSMGQTPLHVACKAGDGCMIECLLTQNAKKDLKDITGAMPLHLFCEQLFERRSGITQTLCEMLVEGSPDLNHKNTEGNTLLLEAVKRENLQMTLALLTYGAQIDIETTTGDWPLHLYCQHNFERISDARMETGMLLVERTPDINHSNKAGQTPLHVACSNNNGYMIECLLTSQALTDVEDNTGSFPLHLYAQQTQQKVTNSSAKAGTMLIEGTQDVNHRNIHGQTPLHNACKAQNKNVMELLLAQRANADVQDCMGNIPLHLFLIHGSPKSDKKLQDVATQLVEKTSDKNSMNMKEETPLSLAFEKKNLYMMKMLLIHGAEVNTADKTGDLPLHHFCSLKWQRAEQDRLCVAKLLVQKTIVRNHKNSEGNTPLHIAVMSTNNDMIKILLEHKAGVNEPDITDSSPLHWLCSQSGGKCANKCGETFVQKTSDQNLVNEEGQGPLPNAVSSNDKHMIECLLKHDAKTDINLENKQGETPLHLAVETQTMPIIEILLNHEARSDIKNTSGNIPLHLHCSLPCSFPPHQWKCKTQSEKHEIKTKRKKFDNQQRIGKLLFKTSDMNLSNPHENTPLHLACQSGNSCMIELLLEHDAMVSRENKLGLLPLHFFCSNDWYESWGKSRELVQTLGRKLIERTSDINHQDHKGSTPLHLAVKPGSVDMAEILLNHKDVKVDIQDSSGSLPLHLFCAWNKTQPWWRDIRLSLGTLLIGKTTNLSHQDEHGDTPLHLAIKAGDLDLVETLLTHQARTDVENCDGFLPLNLFLMSYAQDVRDEYYFADEQVNKVATILIEKTTNSDSAN